MSKGLTRYNAAKQALAEARSVDEVKEILNQAEALKAYARMAKDNQLLADAAEIRERAARRGDELVKAQAKTVGLDKGGGGRDATGVRKTPVDAKPTLAEAGIDKNLAKRFRAAGAIPEEQFEEHIVEVRESAIRAVDKVASDEEKAAVKANKRQATYESRIAGGGTRADLIALAEAGHKFGVIYADPPWTFETYSAKGKGRSAEQHYDTQSLVDIHALPVPALAADDCMLMLWGTWPMLGEALDLIDAWGFDYKTIGFLWVKTTKNDKGLHMGMGYWTRSNSEPCLLATKGNPMRLAQDVHQVVMTSVGDHSQKPAEVCRRIERLVGGPYLELYGRKKQRNWTVWGNEVLMPLAAE